MEYLIYKCPLSIRFSLKFLFLNGKCNLKSIQAEMYAIKGSNFIDFYNAMNELQVISLRW